MLGFRRLGVVDAGPATSNLRDEPPAVVNLLVHARGVKRSAFVATLLELAARDVTEVVEIEPGRYALRLSRDGAPLPTAIERMAVATLRSRRIRRSGISLRRAFPWYRFRPFFRAVVNEAVDRGLLVEQRFLYADWPSVLALVLVVAATAARGIRPGNRDRRGARPVAARAGARSLGEPPPARSPHGERRPSGRALEGRRRLPAGRPRVHERATDVGRDLGPVPRVRGGARRHGFRPLDRTVEARCDNASTDTGSHHR